MVRKALLLAVCCLVGLGLYGQTNTPPTPTDLVAQLQPNTLHTVRLTWQAPTGPWHYKVYRSQDDTMNFSPIGATGMKTFFDIAVSFGNTYFYYVTSFVSSGGIIVESGRSNYAQITIGPPPPPPPRGTIAGTVTDDSTSLPIPHVRIRFFRLNAIWTWTPYTFTDSAGHYEASLDTGVYLVKAEPMRISPLFPYYMPEWYDNAPTPQTATPVAVAESSLFIADFGLSRPVPPSYAYISGTVTDTSGNPLPNAWVTIMRTLQEMNSLAANGLTSNLGNESANIEGVGHTRGVVWRGRTDSLGHYSARVISGRSYIAMASKLGYLPEYYDNKTNPMDADIIVVTGNVENINFSLALNPNLQNSISGMVRDSAGNGVASRVVLFPVRHNTGNWSPHFGHTDSLGFYTINHVRTGSYFVLAVPFTGYAPGFYKANACGIIHWSNADSVVVSGNITGIDICVVPVLSNGIACISGHIESTSGEALGGVSVVAIHASLGVAGIGVTDASGTYSIEAVAPGQVTVYVDKDGYLGNPATLNVSPGTYTVGDVDFVMSSPTVLSTDPEPFVPTSFGLSQNYPNPFNPSTAISVDIPASSLVSLKVYNLIGQEVATLASDEFTAGRHEVVWNGKDGAGGTVASGIYLYRMSAIALNGTASFSQVKKMVLLK